MATPHQATDLWLVAVGLTLYRGTTVRSLVAEVLHSVENGSFGFLGGNSGLNDMEISAPNIALFGNTDLWLANNDNAPSELRFYEANTTTGLFPGGTNYTALQSWDTVWRYYLHIANNTASKCR